MYLVLQKVHRLGPPCSTAGRRRLDKPVTLESAIICSNCKFMRVVDRSCTAMTLIGNMAANVNWPLQKA